MNAVDLARATVARGITDRIFPAAAIEVGASHGVLWREALGTLSFDAEAASTGLATAFDLASLTKVIVTATLAMELVRTGALSLDERVAGVFSEWRSPDRNEVVVRDLLEHASGLPARLLDLPPAGRREFVHDICRMPLEYAPRTRSVYSDLDFILLGFLVADRGGAPLADLFARALEPADAVSEGPLAFALSDTARLSAAPTTPLADDVRRGRRLVGEVHDSYAAALGGSAGHAGLFGSAPCVGVFARTVLLAARGDRQQSLPFSPELISLFTTRSTVPRSSRALGWDTMLPTSSCGTRMSTSAFGHVGFTGTSLWIDPARDRYFVLLTNRACDAGSTAGMQQVRRAFHDALGDV